MGRRRLSTSQKHTLMDLHLGLPVFRIVKKEFLWLSPLVQAFFHANLSKLRWVLRAASILTEVKQTISSSTLVYVLSHFSHV